MVWQIFPMPLFFHSVEPPIAGVRMKLIGDNYQRPFNLIGFRARDLSSLQKSPTYTIKRGIPTPREDLK